MELPDHIAVIINQIERMREDGHDDNPFVSIQLDAIEYETQVLSQVIEE